LALLEPLGEKTLASHEAEGGGEAGGGSTDLVQGGYNLEVEGAGVDLADGAKGAGEAEVFEDLGFEPGDLLGIAAEEGKLVELGADGALEATSGVAGGKFVEASKRGEEFFAEHGKAFTEGGGLGRDVVSAAGEEELAVLFGAFGETEESGGGFLAHDAEGTVNLELFNVFGEVARGEAEVDSLVPGETVEFFDAGFDVVERDALTGVDGGEVDLVLHPLVGGDGGGGDGDAEVALGLHDRNPVVSLDLNAPGGGPDGFDGRRSVALGEDVGDGGRSGSGRFWHSGPATVSGRARACQYLLSGFNGSGAGLMLAMFFDAVSLSHPI